MRLRGTAIGAFLVVGVFGVPLSRFISAGPAPAPRVSAGGAASPTGAASTDLYTTRVRPVFQSNCYRCHGGLNRRGGLQMGTQAGLLKGGHHGPAIVPGHPETSLLVRLIRHEGPADDPMPMPQNGKLSDADIQAVEQWIRIGAPMPPPPADQ